MNVFFKILYNSSFTYNLLIRLYIMLVTEKSVVKQPKDKRTYPTIWQTQRSYFKQAYGSIQRKKLYTIMYEFGLPPKLVRPVRATTAGTEAQVKVQSSLTHLRSCRAWNKVMDWPQCFLIYQWNIRSGSSQLMMNIVVCTLWWHVVL
jgi:hypothetical protein